MNQVPSTRLKLQKEFKSFKEANNHGMNQLKTTEEKLDTAPPWIIASRKIAPGGGNSELLKVAATDEHKTETSSLPKSTPPKSTGTYQGGYVPKRYRPKKGWIRRWLAVFGIGLDHIIVEDPLAEEVVDGLELAPADLRRMMTSFDLIDTGGNGYFDYHVRRHEHTLLYSAPLFLLICLI